jgi:cysteine synthase
MQDSDHPIQQETLMNTPLNIHSSILNRIGNTPLIELKKIVPEGSARILIKIESENPTGSMKDRMALAMIKAAEKDGRLPKGGRVVEYTAGSTGAHKIEGVGAGFLVPLWEPSLVDEIAKVSTKEAMQMARRLAMIEGIFAGTSTGSNLVAALDVARRLGPGATVVTVMCDSGMKYLSTALYGKH